MTLLVESAGRSLEPAGNCRPRGMTVHDRTRLIGRLPPQDDLDRFNAADFAITVHSKEYAHLQQP